MNEPMATTKGIPTGAWSVALCGKLTEEAIAQIRPDTSAERKLEVTEGLVEQLKALREYDRFDPKQMESVVLKRNYRAIGEGVIVAGFNEPRALQVLPDGKIVYGGKRIGILNQTKDGGWADEDLGGQDSYVSCLHALPDGTIVSGSLDHSIRIWSKVVDGQWNSEELCGYTGGVACLQVLPDGRIVSGGPCDDIVIWTKGADSKWLAEVIGKERSCFCLQALPDVRVVYGHANGSNISAKGVDGQWHSEHVDGQWSPDAFSGPSTPNCLQVLSNGRIVSLNEGTIRIWDGEKITRGQS